MGLQLVSEYVKCFGMGKQVCDLQKFTRDEGNPQRFPSLPSCVWLDTVSGEEVCWLLEPEILLEANGTCLTEAGCLEDTPTN